MKWRCRLFGHRYEFTEEYENLTGHVQADEICLRCGDRELGWIGPKASEIRAIGSEVPTMKEAYRNLAVETENPLMFEHISRMGERRWQP